MKQEIKKQTKPVVDEYKGLRRESAIIILTDKNGQETKIKL
jgi:hypothetical protein